MSNDETPTTYPIWTPDHEAYIESCRDDLGYPESMLAVFRAEIEIMQPERIEDLNNFIAGRKAS